MFPQIKICAWTAINEILNVTFNPILFSDYQHEYDTGEDGAFLLPCNKDPYQNL